MHQDPVCGMTVEPATAAATYEYQGETYYFCAIPNKHAFAKEPERYLQQPEAADHDGHCCWG